MGPKFLKVSTVAAMASLAVSSGFGFYLSGLLASRSQRRLLPGESSRVSTLRPLSLSETETSFRCSSDIGRDQAEIADLFAALQAKYQGCLLGTPVHPLSLIGC